jgi:hypothetical protein
VILYATFIRGEDLLQPAPIPDNLSCAAGLVAAHEYLRAESSDSSSESGRSNSEVLDEKDAHRAAHSRRPIVVLARGSRPTRPERTGQRPKSPLYGLYQVEAFTQSGSPLEQNDANWRRVIFEGQNEMTVLTMDDSMLYHYADVDVATNTVTISGERDLDSNQQKESLPKSVLAFSRPDPDHLEFRGNLANHPVVINMQKVDISKFTLVSRGFHWIQNGAFYR